MILFEEGQIAAAAATLITLGNTEGELAEVAIQLFESVKEPINSGFSMFRDNGKSIYCGDEELPRTYIIFDEVFHPSHVDQHLAVPKIGMLRKEYLPPVFLQHFPHPDLYFAAHSGMVSTSGGPQGNIYPYLRFSYYDREREFTREITVQEFALQGFAYAPNTVTMEKRFEEFKDKFGEDDQRIINNMVQFVNWKKINDIIKNDDLLDDTEYDLTSVELR